MERVYIAAPIFNKQQLSIVSAITMSIKLLEYDYFSPYEASQSIWKGRAPKDCSQAERDQVLKGNIDNLHACDLLLCWVGGTDNGKTDTGVVWEMGYFKALNRAALELQEAGIETPTNFTLAYIDPTDKRQNMNLMLAGTVDAVVYGPAQLHMALKALRPAQNHHELAAVAAQHHPDNYLQHEKEPIV